MVQTVAVSTTNNPTSNNMKLTYLIAALAITAALPTLKAADDKPAQAYPLQTCFISGEKLGEMGKPFVFVYEGEEIQLCCKDCKKKFDKDPAAAMKKFHEAVKATASGSACCPASGK